jgi:hypothetical protein
MQSDKNVTSPWPFFDDEMIEASIRVLRSGKVNYWTGTEGRTFEKEYAQSLGVKHAIALSNGTVALELALYALGIGPGDEVVVPARTFIASASCVAIRGATPVVADIDPVSQNLTAATVAAVLTSRTKAIICVHLAGWPCEMDELMALAKERGLYVIEDCAQAHGAMYRGQPVGSFGHINAFSFCQDKILTTAGEGGLVVTNDSAWHDAMWRFKDHGKNPEKLGKNPVPGAFHFVHDQFGTNMRLSEVQSAIGRLQLAKLPEWKAARTRHAECIMDGASNIAGITFHRPAAHIEHAWYKLYAFIEPSQLAPGWSRDRMIQAILAEGVFCGSGSCGEIYRELAFADCYPSERGRLPIARQLHETSLMFQVHPTLTAAEIEQTITAIKKVCDAAFIPQQMRLVA